MTTITDDKMDQHRLNNVGRNISHGGGPSSCQWMQGVTPLSCYNTSFTARVLKKTDIKRAMLPKQLSL